MFVKLHSKMRGYTKGTTVPDARTQNSAPLLVARKAEEPEIIEGELALLRGEAYAMREELEAAECENDRLRAGAARIAACTNAEGRAELLQELLGGA